MAFVPQPTLPRTSNRSSQIRVSIRAAADGIISVSRRRRVYEFLSATSGTTPTTNSDATATPGTTAETTSQSTHAPPAESPDPQKVRHDLIIRMEQREAAIKADAAEKEALWEAELAQLRQPPVQLPEIVPQPTDEEIVEPQPVVSYYPSRSSQTASLFGANDVAPAEPAPPVESPFWEVTKTPSAPAPSVPKVDAVTEPAPGKVVEAPSVSAPTISSVSELYAPPKKTVEEEELSPIEKLQEFVEDAREAVEEVVEDVRGAVENVVEDVIEAFTAEEEKTTKNEKDLVLKEEPEPEPQTELEPKAEAEPQTDLEPKAEPQTELEPKAEAEPEPESTEEEKQDKQDRSIGEVILDAIVEGVPTPEPEGEPEKPAVDKSDLISLIDSGKIKNLTVTKLRRLLSQNGLKTSGRKAELIARLTSFAKAK